MLDCTGGDERSAAAGAQPSWGGGGNIEPQTEQAAKAPAPTPPPSPAPAVPGISDFCTIWRQLASANEAESNKSVPPQQHTGLPAAQRSLCQDTDGSGEGSAWAPENALAEKPITHPVPPTSERDMAEPTGPLERAEHPISRP